MPEIVSAHEELLRELLVTEWDELMHKRIVDHRPFWTGRMLVFSDGTFCLVSYESDYEGGDVVLSTDLHLPSYGAYVDTQVLTFEQARLWKAECELRTCLRREEGERR